MRLPLPLVVVLCIPLSGILQAGNLEAQDVDSLRAAWTVPVPPALQDVPSPTRPVSPAVASGSPTGFGAAGGQVFAGAGYQARTRYLETDDGAVVFGFGLGDPQALAGLEVAVTSASTINTGPFKRTYVSFKAHRMLPGGWAVGLGYEHAVILDFTDPGENRGPDGGQSVYGVASKMWGLAGFTPFVSLATTVGVGGGRFRSEGDILAGEGTAGIFGALALQVARPVAIVADWTGQDLTLGLSFVPFSSFPLMITPGFADVTGRAGDGARFTVGVGAGGRLDDLLGRDR